MCAFAYNLKIGRRYAAVERDVIVRSMDDAAAIAAACDCVGVRATVSSDDAWLLCAMGSAVVSATIIISASHIELNARIYRGNGSSYIIVIRLPPFKVVPKAKK